VIEENYKNSLRILDNICQVMLRLSKSTTGRNTSERGYYGSIIFSKLCLSAIAVQKFLPESKHFSKYNNLEIWDLHSICTLIRTIIDSYNMFFYLLIDDINNDEFNFRVLLWKLHSECERFRFLKLLESTSNKIGDIKNDITTLRSDLINNNYFQLLKDKEKAGFLSGRRCFSISRAQIAKSAGISPKYAKLVYDYLSQYVHTYSFSVMDLRKFRPSDSNSLRLLSTSVDYCIGYLCHVVKDFVAIYPDQLKQIPDELNETIDIWLHITKHFGSNEV